MSTAGVPAKYQTDVLDYRVCYADTDCMGRVYYANYFVMFERGRVSLLRAAGFPYGLIEGDGYLLPVRRCEARYRGFAVFDDELEIVTWITKLRHATITFASGIRRSEEGEFLVTGAVELACVGRDGRPKAMPEKISVTLLPYLEAE